MFRARCLPPGFLLCGLGLCLPLGGCGSSMAPPPVQTAEQQKEEMAKNKAIDDAFKDYQKAEKIKEKTTNRYRSAPE